MTRKLERENFNNKKNIYDKGKLVFLGVEGQDVYNCSIIFEENNKKYIFGRVEKRGEWADSMVYLFEQVAEDTFQVVADSMVYQLEDPFITRIHGEYILGGTHVRKYSGEVDTFYAYFYRGNDIKNLRYFTTGPKRMKDIRLVELNNNKIGVFTRPRGKKILEKFGSEAMIGYTEIQNINELNSDLVLNAELIHGIFKDNEWGGCNQIYRLKNGLLGVIGHLAENNYDENSKRISTYMNISFIFDPAMKNISDLKIIGSRDCYPKGPAKKDYLKDCAFTSGIVQKNDNKVMLLSGIGDCEQGYIVIDNPFEEVEVIEMV